MRRYDIPKARQVFEQMRNTLVSQGETPDEKQEAVLFARALLYQEINNPASVSFCSDSEMFVSSTLTGYAVTGYYIKGNNARVPFNITVRRIDGEWYPSVKYVGSDTKSGSAFIIRWVLLMAGCTLVGLLFYFIIKSVIF